MTPDTKRLRELCEKATPVTVEYIAPTNGLGVPRWSVGGFTRSTCIADEVEGGPFRMDGPTKRYADSIAERLNAVPSLLDEIEKLRAALREACEIAKIDRKNESEWKRIRELDLEFFK